MEIGKREKKSSLGSLQNVHFLPKVQKPSGQGFCMFCSLPRTKPDIVDPQ